MPLFICFSHNILLGPSFLIELLTFKVSLVWVLFLLSSSCLSPSSLSPICLNHTKMEQFYIYLPFKFLISPSVYRIIDWFKWSHMVLTKIYWNYKFVFSNVTYISIVTFCYCMSIYKYAVRYVYHDIYMVQAHYEASKCHIILGNKPWIITIFRFSLSHIYIITRKRRVSICQFGVKWCYQNNVTMIMIIFLANTHPIGLLIISTTHCSCKCKFATLQKEILPVSGAHTHKGHKSLSNLYYNTCMDNNLWILLKPLSFSLLTLFTCCHLLYHYLHL